MDHHTQEIGSMVLDTEKVNSQVRTATRIQDTTFSIFFMVKVLRRMLIVSKFTMVSGNLTANMVKANFIK